MENIDKGGYEKTLAILIGKIEPLKTQLDNGMGNLPSERAIPLCKARKTLSGLEALQEPLQEMARLAGLTESVQRTLGLDDDAAKIEQMVNDYGSKLAKSLESLEERIEKLESRPSQSGARTKLLTGYARALASARSFLEEGNCINIPIIRAIAAMTAISEVNIDVLTALDYPLAQDYWELRDQIESMLPQNGAGLDGVIIAISREECG